MQNEPATKKLLLTGCSSSGKTSIHLIVFGAHPSKDSLSTHNLQGSIITQNKFMGSMSVTIWHSEIEPKYLGSRKEDFFRNVGVLVYVFDVEDERAETMENFKKCVERVSENSKDTPVFVLIHKLDRVASESKVTIFKEKKAKVLKEAESMNVNIKGIYGTSIWDDTLYRAWSEMVQVLTPNLSVYKDTLKHLTTACDCNEAVLFDKKTFLMIEHYEKNPNRDLEKYERVSTIIKQFKLNCKTGTDITSLEIRNTKFVAVIKSFTENTSMMVISLDPKIEPNALDMSVDGAKRYFEKKNENVLLI